jgi:hypothetical protein
MGGKENYNDYAITQGGKGNVVADPTTPTATAVSGVAEPVWPTVPYELAITLNPPPAADPSDDSAARALSDVHDGGVTWTAMYARKTQGAVLGRLNAMTFQHDRVIYPSHYFQYGTLIWLTGQNAGIQVDVRDSLGVVTQDGVNTKPYMQLLEMMPNPIEIGDTFIVTVGCAKTRYACLNFNNVDNLRAFPDMPTEDRALSTPNISNQGYAPKATK